MSHLWTRRTGRSIYLCLKISIFTHSFIHHISPLNVNISKIRLLYVIDLKHERRFNLNWIYVISSPRILRYIRPELGGRPCILVANKTDLVRNRVVRTAGERMITSGREARVGGCCCYGGLWDYQVSPCQVMTASRTIIQCYAMESQ